MFPDDLIETARALLDDLRARRTLLVTAESCTGGLIAGVLTEIPGSSDVVERGFVTYSNAAKSELIGVPEATIAAFGAVSRETASAMAAGALAASRAGVSIAVTGVAGPGGGSPDKPVGLVHLAAATRLGPVITIERRYGDIGRGAIRLATVRDALDLVRKVSVEA